MDWILYAESTGIRMLRNFAKTLRRHALGILAYYDYPISTGPLEGTNNEDQNDETPSPTDSAILSSSNSKSSASTRPDTH